MHKYVIVLTCYDAEHPYTDIVEKFFDSAEEAQKVVEKGVADELETLNNGENGKLFATHFGYDGYAAAVIKDGAGTPTTVYDIVTVGETAMTKYIITMVHYDAPEPYLDDTGRFFDDINEAKRELFRRIDEELETRNDGDPAEPYGVRFDYKRHAAIITKSGTDTPVIGYDIVAISKTYEKKV